MHSHAAKAYGCVEALETHHLPCSGDPAERRIVSMTLRCISLKLYRQREIPIGKQDHPDRALGRTGPGLFIE
ncbi:hypothetical protein Ancab_037846 [Ancistrocladus abbreviatus]